MHTDRQTHGETEITFDKPVKATLELTDFMGVIIIGAGEKQELDDAVGTD